MGRIEELADRYARHIELPWPQLGAGSLRVILVVHDKELDRTLRARVGEFEQRTIEAGHGWRLLDCTTWFAEWMAAEEYREAFFEHPGDLVLKLEGEFKHMVAERVRAALRAADEDTVVALVGVASLYGFLRVSELIRSIDADVRGRLVIFFPGSVDGGNCRLLDARDGWNYHAIVIALHGTQVARGVERATA